MGEKFLHSSKELGGAPRQSNHQRDFRSLRDVRGALVHGLISRCDVKNATLSYHVLLLAEL